jgi:hypothetical protein
VTTTTATVTATATATATATVTVIATVTVTRALRVRVYVMWGGVKRRAGGVPHTPQSHAHPSHRLRTARGDARVRAAECAEAAAVRQLRLRLH